MTDQIKPYRRTALYYETDQMAIIHHSNYIRWFEEARTDLLTQMGFPYKSFEDRGILIPVLEVSCEYKQAVVYDETVLIEPKVTFFNGIKFEIEYSIYGEAKGQLKAKGHSKHCFVDRNMSPIRMKKLHPDICEMFEKTQS